MQSAIADATGIQHALKQFVLTRIELLVILDQFICLPVLLNLVEEEKTAAEHGRADDEYR